MVAFALRSEAQTDSAPAKRVEIDKTQQMLRAYEDDRLVFETRISTGRWDRSTPNGQFAAGWKHRMHYSKLYHNAPMPYSVQVSGNVFIHGFSSVPRRPASHGCIRLPLSGGNPAKRFYEWVETGTPIEIRGRWGGR
jgi:lipoprotein-anchoring transpeptidase ErfK/SrfK